MKNSIRCQAGAFADLPVAKTVAAERATAAAIARGIISPSRLKAIAASAFAAEDVSAYAYVPGRTLKDYAAEQIAQQVECAYLAAGTPTPPAVATILPALGPGVRNTDNEISLTVFGFERKSTPGVIFAPPC
jgi:hypothetical protein